jgi:hypothetical protein
MELIGVGAGMSVREGLEVRVREAVGEVEVVGETVREEEPALESVAEGERVGDGDRVPLVVRVGVREALRLQERGAAVPFEAQAPAQGQGNGAARPGVGQ